MSSNRTVLAVLLPVGVVLGALAWLIPAASPGAPGHELGFAIITAWCFLAFWFVWSVAIGVLFIARTRMGVLGNAAVAVGRLQIALIAIDVLGAVPLLLFRADPDLASLLIGLLTSTLLPAAVVVLSAAQIVLIVRSGRRAVADAATSSAT